MRLVAGSAAVVAASALWAAVIDPAGASATPPTPATPRITVKASPREILSGKASVLSGKVRGELTSVQVQLFKSPYPYHSWKLVGTTTTSSKGTYRFVAHPDRNARYRVRVTGTRATATVPVAVVIHVVIKEQPLPLGRAQVAVFVSHPRDLKWWHPHVQWWFAGGRKGRFKPAPVTMGHKLSPSKLVLYTRVTLPAGLHRWRACFSAPQERALTDSHRPPGCSGQGFRGRVYLPVGFPGPKAIANAEHWLRSRGGRTALAVVDTEGRMHGMNVDQQFITGSVVKAMLLVAYLRRLASNGQHTISSYDNSILYPMIHVSDNNAATECWNIVGNTGLYAVARAAGMTHFSVNSPYGSEWGAAQITAHDQAKFFFEMDSLIPKQFIGYANYLLSTIAGYEAWGIPAVARPLGYKVFWKAGWRPSPDIYLVHQIARLHKGKKTFSIAIMTDGDPDETYGIDTIQGAARALLG